jgi:hypothetical protein
MRTISGLIPEAFAGVGCDDDVEEDDDDELE